MKALHPNALFNLRPEPRVSPHYQKSWCLKSQSVRRLVIFCGCVTCTKERPPVLTSNIWRVAPLWRIWLKVTPQRLYEEKKPSWRIWTHDLILKRQFLCRCATAAVHVSGLLTLLMLRDSICSLTSRQRFWFLGKKSFFSESTWLGFERTRSLPFKVNFCSNVFRRNFEGSHFFPAETKLSHPKKLSIFRLNLKSSFHNFWHFCLRSLWKADKLYLTAPE